MGALLGKYKKASMYFPGGCSIGARPIDLHLKGFTRFSELENGVLYSKISPKNNILAFLMPHFVDRFPMENFMIYDERRNLFGIHPAQRDWYLIQNDSNEEKIFEVTSYFEPVLSKKEQDYAHQAFNNLFLKYEKIENGILIKRNKRGEGKEIFLAVGFFADKGNIEKLEYEIDKEKLYGRLNESIPKKIENSEIPWEM